MADDFQNLDILEELQARIAAELEPLIRCVHMEWMAVCDAPVAAAASLLRTPLGTRVAAGSSDFARHGNAAWSRRTAAGVPSACCAPRHARTCAAAALRSHTPAVTSASAKQRVWPIRRTRTPPQQRSLAPHAPRR
jgi:hypothetical protein